jgi:hypothetical protein
MHFVKEANYLRDYSIVLTFDDDRRKLVDLREHLTGPIFQPLKDPSYFKQVSLNTDIDTICWPNGADMSPDFLYEIGQDV